MNTVTQTAEIENRESSVIAQTLPKKSAAQRLNDAQELAWSKVVPFWTLKNLIAVNPLAGFEDLPFEEALNQGQAYFEQSDLPQEMQNVNRVSIKWLQAYFDYGQASLPLPDRERGLLAVLRSVLPFDKDVVLRHSSKDKEWLAALPDDPKRVIAKALLKLGLSVEQHELFLTLMLTTLPGWASYIQYRTSWSDCEEERQSTPVTQDEYLAVRLVIVSLIWPSARMLLDWHECARRKADMSKRFEQICDNESRYRAGILKSIQKNAELYERQFPKDQEGLQTPLKRPDAQLVFCIDVRSEPFRRALEAQGAYETLGFAGFFGVPISVKDDVSEEQHASCPVLLKPGYVVRERPVCSLTDRQMDLRRKFGIKRLYQSLKYTFTAPFALVEGLGLFSGLWMALRSLAPHWAAKMSQSFSSKITPSFNVETILDSISPEEQVSIAAGALGMMGLTKNFGSLVIFCGHGSHTENNAYASALDCGACGGHEGAPNARVLASILNQDIVRKRLAEDKNISIPEDTYFMAAQHNTTNDDVRMFSCGSPDFVQPVLQQLQADMKQARAENSLWRLKNMGVDVAMRHATAKTQERCDDWAQVRPEWGLAKNAAFIIAPRPLTQNIPLEGRAFLHSYDWAQDPDGASLTVILTAPMVVAQWINSQYLFSTVNNVAYGGGSKVTSNITGKMGVMQGNASDLMHGLPLQSVFGCDEEAYHEPQRLMSVVYAPRMMIDKVIQAQAVLKKLFGNEWVALRCIEPKTNEVYALQPDFSWSQI